MLDADFALFNVDQLVTVAAERVPQAQGPLGIVRRGALAAAAGKIVWVGPMDALHQNVRLRPDATVINTHGRTVLPGFVDPHTHPVFAGTRVTEFYERTQAGSAALSYEGMKGTVQATRAASEDILLDLAYARADTFLQYGTTTIGAKTGYGLTQADEMKCLRVLNRLQRLHRLKVIPEFLGARVVPPDFDGTADEYVDAIIRDWLPAARDRAQFVDVWCDEGAFTAEQCRRILQRARELGFSLTAHVNELGPHGGVRMAASTGATSVDHLAFLDADDIGALRDSGAVAVLLPGTSFFLNEEQYAPARALLDAGVPVALGTDFNPETSYTQNMQFILTLGVLKLAMSAEEVIVAATLGGARALGMADRVGSLEPGKFCDFAIYQVEDYRQIPYRYGMNCAETVVAGGEILVQDGKVSQPARAVPVG